MPADNMQANMAAAPNAVGKQLFSFWINLAGLTDADVLTSFVPGFKFAIESVNFAVQKAVTTAAKLATITPKISSVAISGGVLSLTSDNCTPKGVVVAGSAVVETPLGAANSNHGSATDSISLTASAVTAFVEGDGQIEVLLHNLEVGIP